MKCSLELGTNSGDLSVTLVNPILNAEVNIRTSSGNLNSNLSLKTRNGYLGFIQIWKCHTMLQEE